MTTLSDLNIERVASSCWEVMYTTRFELACALVFLSGWLLGKWSQNRNKAKLSKNRSQNGCSQKADSYSKWKPSPLRARQGKTMDKVKAFKAFDGQIEQQDPAMLADSSWVLPQISQLCQSDVPQALLLYRAAIEAGLKLPDVPADARHQFCVCLVSATIRSGNVDECIHFFSELRQCGLDVSHSLFASSVKLCTSKQLFAEALRIFDFVSEDSTFALTDQSIWSCLLFCATETKTLQQRPGFFEKIKECGTPSPQDFGNMIRAASQSHDWEACLSLVQQMRDANVEVDSVQYNTTLATCVGAGKVDEARTLLGAIEDVAGVADVITYNTIIKGYAKAGEINGCFELYERMLAKHISPSQVTFGILLDCCINANELNRAKQVFDSMVASKCPMNTVLYTTLIKGFARAGELDEAMAMYKQMSTESNASPDVITFSILIKANCDNKRLEEALRLLEDMIELGLKPDEVVFNNLIAGCSLQGNAPLGRQLYDDMVRSGVRPSNATFSILIRLLHNCKLLDQAVVLLKTEPAKHHVAPEARLFLQLIQSCIRERQGKRAVEVYELFAKHSTPTVASHNSMISTCMRLNMYETAAEIVSMAVESGARVDARDTGALLEASFRKGKSQVARSCVASMEALGHAIDSNLVDSLQQASSQRAAKMPLRPQA